MFVERAAPAHPYRITNLGHRRFTIPGGSTARVGSPWRPPRLLEVPADLWARLFQASLTPCWDTMLARECARMIAAGGSQAVNWTKRPGRRNSETPERRHVGLR
jgi:hypothetical protein